MNEDIQLKILELIDGGASPENSLELKGIIEASDEATKFYENILVTESLLESYFGKDKAKEIDSKIDALVEEQLASPKMASSFYLKPFVGFAIAACLALIALTFIDIPSNESLDNFSTEETNLVSEIEYTPDLIVLEESEPLVISGSEIDTLWSTAIDMADELGVDMYEVMYIVYEGNKDSFIDNNIHQPRRDKDYFVDLSIIENLETQFIIDEVKRHIYCRC